MRILIVSCLFLAAAAEAQLIPVGAPVPIRLKPPVVFVDGYQRSCGDSQFSNNFGGFDQYLQATNRISLFFDNCTFSGKPSIEELGNNFRDFLAALKYTDGTPVPEVDIVAHSMGGLIVRSYLAGKQNAAGVFQPPVKPGIRKAVFLATPHFGTPLAGNPIVGFFASDIQTDAMINGSLFCSDLATWNQGTDALGGIDAGVLEGRGGPGFPIRGEFDDGLFSFTGAPFANPPKKG